MAEGIEETLTIANALREAAARLRDAGLADRFRLFLGTRTLVDAGVAIGAHGAIPAISNVAPAPCAEAYEAAGRGDFAAAARAQELVIRYENLSQVARGGSGNAATISTMKHVLHVWDVIADPAVTRPLRPLADDEVAELRRRLELLPAAAPGRSVEEAVPV
jgi:4-hydroxy-tetrahydrodipicolinate synthase